MRFFYLPANDSIMCSVYFGTEGVSPLPLQIYCRSLVQIESADTNSAKYLNLVIMLVSWKYVSGYSKTSAPSPSGILTTLKILSDHYPERLAKAFIVDASSMFYHVWKVRWFFDRAVG